MATTIPSASLPNAKPGYFAWRGTVRKRQSTDHEVLDHPLVREAYAQGFERGVKTKLALEAEFASVLARLEVLESAFRELLDWREAIEMVDEEEEDD